jgi:hypothetical protein
MIDPRYSHHQKALLVISDGAFNEDSSIMVVADMLKKRGVSIISAMIHPQNLLQKLFPRGSEHWPEGAKTMLTIASDTPEAHKKNGDSVLEQIQALGKFFYHINNPAILDELLNTFFCARGYFCKSAAGSIKKISPVPFKPKRKEAPIWCLFSFRLFNLPHANTLPHW